VHTRERRARPERHQRRQDHGLEGRIDRGERGGLHFQQTSRVDLDGLHEAITLVLTQYRRGRNRGGAPFGDLE
jgi:hypothetical protein